MRCLDCNPGDRPGQVASQLQRPFQGVDLFGSWTIPAYMTGVWYSVPKSKGCEVSPGQAMFLDYAGGGWWGVVSFVPFLCVCVCGFKKKEKNINSN